MVSSSGDALLPAVAVDTVGRRFQVEWDPDAPVTPLGQLVFFCQFLAAGGLYSKWVAECPLRYASPNAPSLKDLLGTWVLASLSGAWRYAHVTALRGDRVNPQGLGMEKVVSEDSLRRAFQNQNGTELATWQTEALLRTYAPALEQPWMADLDVTVQPLYGHQEGAELGYNPRKGGASESCLSHRFPAHPAGGVGPPAFPCRRTRASKWSAGPSMNMSCW